jgi:hypothetical protein
MKKPSVSGFVSPFGLWWGVAQTTSEMMMASAQVVNHRLTQMSNSDLIPNAKDQKEFNLMSQEKVDAVSESMMAMSKYWFNLNHTMGQAAVNQMFSISNDLTSLASSTSPSEALTRQMKLADSLSQSALTASKFSQDMATMTAHGLKPVHKRAVANAKRLGKKA